MSQLLVSISGMCAVGKTSFIENYALNGNAFIVVKEPFENNHFFKLDKPPFAMANQIEFLIRFVDSVKANKNKYAVLRDRVYEEVMLFTDFMYSMGDLTFFEHDYIKKCYFALKPQVKAPDVVFFLKLSTLEVLDRLHKRNRPEESKLDIGFISKLNDFYTKHFKDYFTSDTIINEICWSDSQSKQVRNKMLIDKIDQLHCDSITKLYRHNVQSYL